MADEFFTRSGWTVALGSPYAGPVLETLRHQRFDAVGFSFVQPSTKLGLAKEIRWARSISLNRDLRVVVGGGAAPPFLGRPEALEADIVLTDLEEAPDTVAELLG